MAFRAAALLVMLAVLAGCDWTDHHLWRKPCEPDAAPGTCCPLGSHEVVTVNPDLIVCAADDVPCADAGTDAGACADAGTDAH